MRSAGAVGDRMLLLLPGNGSAGGSRFIHGHDLLQHRRTTRRNVKPLLYCLIILVAAAFPVTGCRGTAAAPASPGSVVFGSTADRQSDPFALNSAEISGNTLTISVSFSGGCRNHVFVLTAARFFLESSPVQLPMVLTHEDHDDPCEAYPTENRRFDLTPIKERYRMAYGQDSGSVRLLLRPAPNTDQPLVYEF